MIPSSEKNNSIIFVNNETAGFAPQEECINSENFQIEKLFSVPEVNISRCISNDDDESLFFMGKKITDIIPSSCKTEVCFVGPNCEMIVDSGAEMTILRPEHLNNQEILFEKNGRVKLMAAFGEPIEADLIMIQCRLVENGIKYPFINLQVAVTDKLNGNGLLSLNDYKSLSYMTVTAIPTAKYAQGQIILNMNDEPVGGGRFTAKNSEEYSSEEEYQRFSSGPEDQPNKKHRSIYIDNIKTPTSFIQDRASSGEKIISSDSQTSQPAISEEKEKRNKTDLAPCRSISEDEKCAADCKKEASRETSILTIKNKEDDKKE